MPSAAEFADMLRARLPEGPAWSPSDQTDGTTAWDGLLAALAQEPARIYEDSVALLNKLIPDNEDCDLVEWEKILGAPDTNLTDEERLARIRGILRFNGEIDFTTLQNTITKMVGDDEDVILYNRPFDSFAAGIAGAGCGVGSAAFYWGLELWDNVLARAPDAAWDGTAVTANFARSPVTTGVTAQRIVFGASGADLRVLNEMPGVADDADVYFSAWVRAASGTSSIDIRFVTKDSMLTNAGSYTVDTHWRKITYQANVGAGAFNPFARINAANTTIYLSYSLAGVRNDSLEARLSALFPLHTRGAFAVKDEYATQVANNPQDVTY